MRWMDEFGDRDGDGFLSNTVARTGRPCQPGLEGQHDSIFHADGTIAEGPIALAEVQAYAYDAKRLAARSVQRLGRADQAEALDAAADRLAERFDASFWCEEIGMYALALDGAKQPCRVRSSNAGQVLFSGIVAPTGHARSVRR